MAINGIRNYLKNARAKDLADEREQEKLLNNKRRIIFRLFDSNNRELGLAFRQALRWTRAERDKERALYKKKRGIIMRMLDSNERLLAEGWNKLLDVSKLRKQIAKGKVKFLIATLGNRDLTYILEAYNALKQRCDMLNGKGTGQAQMKKIHFIKRLLNKGYSLQLNAINALKRFLRNERDKDDANRLRKERMLKDKDRILRRLLRGNLRYLGMAFRQAYQFM